MIRVLLVTDPAYPEARIAEVAEAAARALPRGEFAVQVRDKHDSIRRRDLAHVLTARLHDTGSEVIINGDIDLALELASRVVHVPASRSVASARGATSARTIFASVHDEKETLRALAEGADALLVSPVFASPGKGRPRGVGALAEAISLVKRARRHGVGIYALGGIDVDNAKKVFAAGAHGVAVVRALLDADEPAAVARALAQSSIGPRSSPDWT